MQPASVPFHWIIGVLHLLKHLPLDLIWAYAMQAVHNRMPLEYVQRRLRTPS